jgi:hypothetical protein
VRHGMGAPLRSGGAEGAHLRGGIGGAHLRGGTGGAAAAAVAAAATAAGGASSLAAAGTAAGTAAAAASSPTPTGRQGQARSCVFRLLRLTVPVRTFIEHANDLAHHWHGTRVLTRSVFAAAVATVVGASMAPADAVGAAATEQRVKTSASMRRAPRAYRAAPACLHPPPCERAYRAGDVCVAQALVGRLVRRQLRGHPAALRRCCQLRAVSLASRVGQVAGEGRVRRCC